MRAHIENTREKRSLRRFFMLLSLTLLFLTLLSSVNAQFMTGPNQVTTGSTHTYDCSTCGSFGSPIWELSGGGQINGSNTGTSASVTWNTAGTYTVEYKTRGTVFGSMTVTVGTVPSMPPVPIIDNDNCTVAYLSYNPAPPGSTRYKQTSSTGTSTGDVYPGGSGWSVNSNGTYYIRDKNAFGWSPTRVVSVVTDTTIPTASASAPVSYICSPQDVTFTASSGYDKWYTSPTGGTPFHTGLTYTEQNMSSTVALYVEAWTAFGCKSTSRAAVSVTYQPALSPGSISGAHTICYNGNPSALTNSGSPSGGNGSFSYQWKESTNNSTWSNASGSSTGITYDPGNLTSDRWYKREVSSCGQTDESNVIKITVRAALSPGDIGNPHSVCYNGNPSVLTNTVSPTGGDDNYSYQWKYSTTGTGGWQNVPSGGGNSTYDPGPLTADRWYKREVTSCGQTLESSSIIKVTVHDPLDGGDIGNPQTVCYNGDPSVLTNTASPTGGDGNYQYQWKYSTTGTGGWQDVPSGGGNITYDPGALTADRWYKRVVTNCGGTAESNIISVTVRDPLGAGNIGNPQTICQGADPSALTNTASPTGGDLANYAYQWRESSDNVNWSDITVNGTSITYDPGTLTADRWYKREVSSCGETVESNVIAITVDAASNGGSLATTGAPAEGFGSASGTLQVSGHTGNVVKWQYKTTGTWVDISNTNTTQPFSVSDSTTYRVEVKNSVCASAYSNEFLIAILTSPSVSNGGSSEIRPGQNTTLTADAGHSNYEWFKNDVSIQNSASNTLVVSEPANYHVTVTSSGGATHTTSYSVVSSQLSPNENAVISYDFRVAVDTSNVNVYSYTNQEISISADQFDGLGRPTQKVSLESSPLGSDLVAPVVYDDLGRAAKNYLPYPEATSTTTFKSQAVTDQVNYYQNTSSHATAQAFSEQKFEASPLNRVVEQGAAGDTWKLGSGHTVTMSYDLNDASEVIEWEYTNLLTQASQHYAAGELYENTTTDEDGNQTTEYTDKQGRTILKKSQVDGSTDALTYYIYDIRGRLMAVLPPEATSRLSTEFFGQSQANRTSFLTTWAFLYNYDYRARMTMKKVPGADSVFMVYDKWNRLVLTQDGVQRTTNEWLFTKYDGLNRPIMTGIMTSSLTADSIRSLVAVSTARLDSLDATGTNQYTNYTYPTSGVSNYLTVTYYDDYAFQSHADWTSEGLTFSDPLGQLTQETKVKGQVTGTMTKTGNGSWIRSVSYYDDKYRPIQTQSTNHLGGKDVVTNYYDFIGQVTKTISSHNDGSKTTDITRRFEYDHAGRLLKTYHQVTEDMQWTDLVGVSVNGNELTKTATTGWGNGGAASVQKIPEGSDGWIEFTAQTNHHLLVGLSETNADAHYNTIGYSFNIEPSWNVKIYENGTNRGTFGTYTTGDVFRVERQGSTVLYKKNGTLLYTSTVSSNTSLVGDVCIQYIGEVIADARITFEEAQIAENSYNELGELIEKDLHAGEQSVDYTYNVRGWLTAINNSNLSGGDGDLFGMELYYDQTTSGLTGQTSLYNGNISATKWSDHASVGTGKYRGYTYGYDKLNRLTAANHFENNTSSTSNYGLSGIGYDLNGNIDSLKRYNGASVYMDDLTYTYTGNQLMEVSDAAPDSLGGFTDKNTTGDDYAYDPNGNMVKDLNKEIDSIYYNHLNLPILVDFAIAGDSIEYLYDAAGIKLQQAVYNGGKLTKKTDYVGEFIYENHVLQLIQHEEGRLVPKSLELIMPVDTTDIELMLTLDGNANDTSGNGRNGTVNGAILVSDRDGNADSSYDLDGTDDYIDLSAHDTDLTALTQGTLSVWFKTSSTAIQSIVGAGNATTNWFYISIGGNLTGQFADESLQIALKIGGTYQIVACIRKGTNYYNDGQWHHLTYRVDNASNKIYIDGVEETLAYQFGTSGTTGNHFLDVNAGEFGFGRSFYPGNAYYFDGSLDEFNIFSRALSEPEILELARGTNPGEMKEAGANYDYQYHLKDHLGNTRLTFSTTPENYTLVETFETGEDNGFQDLHRHTNVNANTTSGGNEVERLQSGQTGALVFLSVNKGDTVDLSVQANYETAPSGNTFLQTGYNALFTSFDNAYGGTEGVTGTANEFNDALSGTGMAGKNDASTAPRAFLNYIIFDRDMNYLTAGFQQISTGASGVGTHENVFINDILPEQDGYILGYLSNENTEAVDVHFDDFTIYHGKTNVVQSDDYYPFGLTFNGYQRTGGKVNFMNTFQNQERDDASGWVKFKWRNHMPEIGRFFNVDPIAEDYFYNSPYAFSENKVINAIELEGLEKLDVKDGKLVMTPLPSDATKKEARQPTIGGSKPKSNFEAKQMTVGPGPSHHPGVHPQDVQIADGVDIGSTIMAVGAIKNAPKLLKHAPGALKSLKNLMSTTKSALKGGDNLIENSDEVTDAIVNINKKFSDGSELNEGAISSAVNSASYYDNIADQGSSIFNSIVGHAFNNGNKRTASEFITEFANANSLTLKVDAKNLENLTGKMADGALFSVEELTSILFK